MRRGRGWLKNGKLAGNLGTPGISLLIAEPSFVILSTPAEISPLRRLKIPPPRKLSDADRREAPEKQLS